TKEERLKNSHYAQAICAVVDDLKKLTIPDVSGSLPSDDRIVAEAIQVARKVDTEVGLLPSNNDIKMFCLGAKWMRDLAQSNDH
ncbi:MAG TPA: hypothetical protein GX731_09030, partial [Clostridiales bacterium]|nr:hypothetical protein [Clostridiales bacterium]